MAVIALTIKRSITPHIRSCKTSKQAWDVLKTMFQSKNNAQISFLKKELDNVRMSEGDSMVDHLTKVQDL